MPAQTGARPGGLTGEGMPQPAWPTRGDGRRRGESMAGRERKEGEVHEDGARTLVACVRVARAEEGENDDGVLSMRMPAREEAA